MHPPTDFDNRNNQALSGEQHSIVLLKMGPPLFPLTADLNILNQRLTILHSYKAAQYSISKVFTTHEIPHNQRNNLHRRNSSSDYNNMTTILSITLIPMTRRRLRTTSHGSLRPSRFWQPSLEFHNISLLMNLQEELALQHNI